MPAYTVYRDGILLPTTSCLRLSDLPFPVDILPLPRIVANIPKSSAPRVDLARTEVVGQSDHWASPIVQAYVRHRCVASVESLLALEPSERWHQLGRLMAYNNINSDSLWQTFPHRRWPLLVLEPEGYITVLEWQEMATSALHQF